MNESRAPRDQPLGRWQTGASQLSLVEHAICPLDSQTSLQQNLRQSSEYRYALVRRQLLTILRAVNKARASMGYELVPHSALLLRRHIVEPFAAPSELCKDATAVVIVGEQPESGLR